MPRMRLPVLDVLRRQCFVTGALDVLRALLLGGLRVIERAADDDVPLDDDLIMGTGVLGIDWGGNPRVRQKVGGGRPS